MNVSAIESKADLRKNFNSTQITATEIYSYDDMLESGDTVIASPQQVLIYEPQQGLRVWTVTESDNQNGLVGVVSSKDRLRDFLQAHSQGFSQISNCNGEVCQPDNRRAIRYDYDQQILYWLQYTAASEAVAWREYGIKVTDSSVVPMISHQGRALANKFHLLSYAIDSDDTLKIDLAYEPVTPLVNEDGEAKDSIIHQLYALDISSDLPNKVSTMSAVVGIDTPVRSFALVDGSYTETGHISKDEQEYIEKVLGGNLSAMPVTTSNLWGKVVSLVIPILLSGLGGLTAYLTYRCKIKPEKVAEQRLRVEELMKSVQKDKQDRLSRKQSGDSNLERPQNGAAMQRRVSLRDNPNSLVDFDGEIKNDTKSRFNGDVISSFVVRPIMKEILPVSKIKKYLKDFNCKYPSKDGGKDGEQIAGNIDKYETTKAGETILRLKTAISEEEMELILDVLHDAVVKKDYTEINFERSSFSEKLVVGGSVIATSASFYGIGQLINGYIFGCGSYFCDSAVNIYGKATESEASFAYDVPNLLNKKILFAVNKQPKYLNLMQSFAATCGDLKARYRIPKNVPFYAEEGGKVFIIIDINGNMCSVVGVDPQRFVDDAL